MMKNKSEELGKTLSHIISKQQWRWNRFILSRHVGRFPKLQTCNTVWFRESNGLCNCVVLFKLVRNW
jgi:hypothetical protein